MVFVDVAGLDTFDFLLKKISPKGRKRIGGALLVQWNPYESQIVVQPSSDIDDLREGDPLDLYPFIKVWIAPEVPYCASDCYFRISVIQNPRGKWVEYRSCTPRKEEGFLCIFRN